MPIYEYKCTKCKHEFEVYEKVNDFSFHSCPKCNGMTIRLLSAPVVKSFNPQSIDDIQDKPVYVKNKQEVTDAVNKFNDSELASKQGKVRVYE